MLFCSCHAPGVVGSLGSAVRRAVQRQAGYIQALLRGLQKRCFLSALCSHSPEVGGDGLPDVKESSQARQLGSNSNTRGGRDEFTGRP